MCHHKHTLGSLIHLLFTVKIESVVGKREIIKHTSYECHHLKRVKWIINKPCNEDFFFVIRAWSICLRCTTAYRLIVRPLSSCDF